MVINSRGKYDHYSPKGFILMTALPPTRGHVYLIEWAAQFCRQVGINHLMILIGGTPDQPFHTKERARTLREHLLNHPNNVGVHYVVDYIHKPMPDQPFESETFWHDWIDNLQHKTMFNKDDIIFGSEPYIYSLASILGVKAIPMDFNRSTVSISGTQVRKNPFYHFKEIIPEAQQLFRKTVTIFGAESTGKTTLAKSLAVRLGSAYTPEWARPYLESLPSPETTPERMETIVVGQAATERQVERIDNVPFIFRDTDLLSTIGYYRIYMPNDYEQAAGYQLALQRFQKADLYLVASSGIKFTPDPLRYGGDHRESSDTFWINLCSEFECRTMPLITGDRKEVYIDAENVVKNLFLEHPLWGYERQSTKV